jgi:hypothetical protein
MGRWGGAAALLALLAGCTGSPMGGGSATTAESTDAPGAALPVAGTAFPAGYRIDAAHSLILGEGESWTGRLVYTAAQPADDVFAVLRRDMPKFGWVEIYAVRADVDLLGFQSQATGRVANIRIERSSMLDSTRVDMIVSPAGDGKPPSQARPLRIPQ